MIATDGRFILDRIKRHHRLPDDAVVGTFRTGCRITGTKSAGSDRLIFGTAKYISPEGAAGHGVAAPGDVYAIATMVYQMLAGVTPFDGEATVGILLKHIHDPPPELRSHPHAAYVPDAIARIVMENLAKDPSLRAPNGRAFGAALATAAHSADVAAPRLSYAALGVMAPSMVPVPSRIAVAPTLDDSAGVVAPTIARNSTEPLVPITSSSPPAERASAAPRSGAPAGPDRQTTHAGRTWLLVLLAFLLGGALVGLGLQFAHGRADAERAAYVAKTRHALADSRYVSPPGDNVRDLVVKGLERWPADPDLLQLRSTASIELVTRSMVEEKAGDVAGARELARQATELDPTDHIAALRLKDCDDTLKLSASDAGAASGPPRVVFDAEPATVAPGQRVEITARVVPGALGPKAKATGAKLTLYDHLDPKNGTPMTLTEVSALHYKGTWSPPRAGNYDLVFTVAVDATNLRAQREVGVVGAE